MEIYALPSHKSSITDRREFEYKVNKILTSCAPVLHTLTQGNLGVFFSNSYHLKSPIIIWWVGDVIQHYT